MKIRIFSVFIFSVIFLLSKAIAEPFVPVTIADPGYGVTGGGDGDSSQPVFSADGRYVLFVSTANNLVLFNGNNALPVNSPAVGNVYLRDRVIGTTTLVSFNVNATGGGNADCIPVAVSTNGQFALFESASTNLVASVTNRLKHIFFTDLANKITTWADTNVSGYVEARNSTMTPDGRYVAFTAFSSTAANIFVRDITGNLTTQITAGTNESALSDLADITPNGRYLAFYSLASNVVSGVTTPHEIYVRDLIAGTTIQASAYGHTVVSNAYGSANFAAFSHCLSDDGKYVAYAAAAYGSMTKTAILRYNVTSGTTDLISTNGIGIPPNTDMSAHNLDMSADGRFVTFLTATNSNSYVMVWDAQNGTSTLISADYNNVVPTISLCTSPVIDGTGRYVSFVYTGSSNLTTNPVVAGSHLFVRDLQAAKTSLVDADLSGSGSSSNPSTFPRISETGGYIAYEAYNAALVFAGAPNSFSDVLVYSITSGTNELISPRRAELPSSALLAASFITSYSVNYDGSIITFATASTNAAPGITNTSRNIILHNTNTGANSLANTDNSGFSSVFATDPSISADGRYISFSSYSTNIGFPQPTNATENIFLRDTAGYTSTLISVNSNATSGGNAASYSSVVSSDGKRVLFHSIASNLVAGVNTPNADNVFIRDLQLNRTYALLTNVSTTVPAAAVMTPDGHFAAVCGTGANLYVWSLLSSNIVYTSTTAKSATALGISPDGTRIGAEISGGSIYAINRMSNTTVNLGAGPTLDLTRVRMRFDANSRFMTYVTTVASVNQVFVYDFQTGTNQIISKNYPGNGIGLGGNGHSDYPDISANGRYIVYRSVASNLVPGVSNATPNIYLYDQNSGDTTLVTVSQLGNFPATGKSYMPVFSGDGNTLFIQAAAADLSAQGYSALPQIYALSLIGTNSQAPFPITIVTNIPAQFTIRWPAIPAKSYQVQYKTNLLDANWSVLTHNITIVGTQATISDNGTNSQRFYRVVGF